MKKIVLISCVSKKLDTKAKVKDIYISPLFLKNMKFAKNQNPEETYILSALHGLISLEDEIDPYDLTLNDMSTAEKGKWARRVFAQIKEKIPDYKDVHFVILAGMNYRELLEPVLPHTEMPLEGKPIGKQLQELDRLNAEFLTLE